MQRRQFLTRAGLAAAAPLVAAPALAQTSPVVKWRLTSSFPATLDLIYGAATRFAQIVAEASDNQFQIEVHPAGELAGALDAFEAVRDGTVECAQTALHYNWGIEPALVFATAVPFGMNSRGQNAFFRVGGGTDLFNDILAPHHMIALPAGNTGCQMGGWMRRELKSAADFKGLKFRISGFAGKVLQGLGCELQAVARGDLAGALESGTLDAAAWVSPYDDEKLSLVKVAPWYYYPGWWQGSMAIHLAINLDAWNALSKAYQAIVAAAAETVNADMQAHYDALNPAALKRLVTLGAKLRPFPQDALAAAWQAAHDIYRDMAAADANFSRAADAYMAFRNDEYLWWQVAEYPYDNFIIRQRAKG